MKPEYALKSEFIKKFNKTYGNSESTETSVTGGFPDILYHRTETHSTGLIETKMGTVSRAGKAYVAIDPEQIVWHITWNKAGANAFILVRFNHKRSGRVSHVLIRSTDLEFLTGLRKSLWTWDEVQEKSVYVDLSSDVEMEYMVKLL